MKWTFKEGILPASTDEKMVDSTSITDVAMTDSTSIADIQMEQ